MQNSTNVFSKGMISDMHPLSTPLDVYTDALNATLLTYNGNENMMQNDMGNTLIQDAKTGNLMGLRPGFIPVGMVEHGGVMYIASVNKLGQGEIGMIPSPVIQFNKDKTYVIDNLLDSNLFLQLITENRTESDLAKLTTDKISAGELFATVLLIEDELNPNKVIVPFKLMGMSEPLRLIYPKFSLDTELESDEERKFKSIYGLYKVNLYAKTDDLMFSLSDQTSVRHTFYTTDSVEPENQCYYWFYATDKNPLDVVLDLDLMIANNHSDDNPYPSFLRYPNVASGYPSVSIEKDIRITDFTLSPNFNVYKESGDTEERQHPHAHPVTFFDKEGTGKYYIMFPEFWYKANSAVNIDRIKVYVTNSTTGEKVTLFRKNPIIETGEELELTGLDRYIRPNLSKLRVPMWNDSFGNFEPGDEWFKLTNANQLNNAVPTDELTYKYASLWSDDKKLNNDYRNESLFYFSIDGSLNQWYTLHVDYYNNNWDYPIGSYDLDFNQYQMDIKHNYQEIDITYEFDYPGVQIEGSDTLKYAKVDQYYIKGLAEEFYIYNKSNEVDPSLPFSLSDTTLSDDGTAHNIIKVDLLAKPDDPYFNGITSKTDYLYHSDLEKAGDLDCSINFTKQYVLFCWEITNVDYILLDYLLSRNWSEATAEFSFNIGTLHNLLVKLDRHPGISQTSWSYKHDWYFGVVVIGKRYDEDNRYYLVFDVPYESLYKNGNNGIWDLYKTHVLALDKLVRLNLNTLTLTFKSANPLLYDDDVYEFSFWGNIESEAFDPQGNHINLTHPWRNWEDILPSRFIHNSVLTFKTEAEGRMTYINCKTSFKIPVKADYLIIPQFNLIGMIEDRDCRFGISELSTGNIEVILSNLLTDSNYLLYENRETSNMNYRFGEINTVKFLESSLDTSNILEFKASGSYRQNIVLERGIYYFNINTSTDVTGLLVYDVDGRIGTTELAKEVLIVTNTPIRITDIDFSNLVIFQSAGLYKIDLFIENSEASQRAKELLELTTVPMFITEDINLYAVPQAVWNYSEIKGDGNFSTCIDTDYELNMLPIHGYLKLYGLYIFDGESNAAGFLVDGRHFIKTFRYLNND